MAGSCFKVEDRYRVKENVETCNVLQQEHRWRRVRAVMELRAMFGILEVVDNDLIIVRTFLQSPSLRNTIVRETGLHPMEFKIIRDKSE